MGVLFYQKGFHVPAMRVMAAGGINKRIDLYIPIDELRSVLRAGLDDACDVIQLQFYAPG